MQVILAAAGCGQLSEIREIVTKHHQVILGSMDGSRLNSLVDVVGKLQIPVCFYETG
ncbi:hypothetical protein P378_03500 [Desulforamulus profundi]|uniref:Uncharacterized protein n=1 Tax=Desulforamulus profundi TaxID=1383067 RepID=A0A2C6MAT5_9FIRM|nr:hypothetical protein [Desulforamulus profundi]MCL4439915.1 hypothetical protein [Bacillota bacterium]MCL5780802.1 hypothetical protein [Bacillota bacterium]PHJ39487.1 hypothetical protein P378_03500 [Desulforamulus profundi]